MHVNDMGELSEKSLFAQFAEWLQHPEELERGPWTYDTVKSELQGLKRDMKGWKSDCLDYAKLRQQCNAALNEVKAILKELHEWKKSATQQMSHRERYRTRKPTVQRDHIKSLTTRLTDLDRLLSGEIHQIEKKKYLKKLSIYRDAGFRSIGKKLGRGPSETRLL